MPVPAGKLTRAMFWAGTWAAGTALGVALGGWLTVVGSAGAPGVASLDLVEDVLLLPGLVGLAVFALHLAGQAIVGGVRRRRSTGVRHEADE